MTRQETSATELQNVIDNVCHDEAVQMLAEMVGIRSVFDPEHDDGNERGMADFICRHLDDWGIEYTRWDVVPNRPNLVVDLPGGEGPVLIFEGHMDVVTAGNPLGWDHDPFSAEIVGNRMYGRGTADMKGGLTALLLAAKAMHASQATFPGTLRLAILSDEEGMMQGARSFVERGYLDDAAAAIICEPEGGRVCVAQKGALRMSLTFTGKMAHGCMPDEGANPVLALAECVVALRELEAEVLSERESHSLLGRFSISPTVVVAGESEQSNVIPASARLMLDIRTTPEHNHAAIVTRIREVCGLETARIAGVQFDSVVLDDRPATETDPQDPIVDAAVTAHEQTFGATPEIGGVPGSTDGTIFWMERRTPLVTWGPGDTAIPHQTNEYVQLDEVTDYARAYVRAAWHYFEAAGEAR